MILLAFRHGLRASELCDLQWTQVDFEAGVPFLTRVTASVPLAPVRNGPMRSSTTVSASFATARASACACSHAPVTSGARSSLRSPRQRLPKHTTRFADVCQSEVLLRGAQTSGPALGAATGRSCYLCNRAPGPPSFASTKTMPALSRVSWIAWTRIGPTAFPPSNRATVFGDTFAARARRIKLHPRAVRADDWSRHYRHVLMLARLRLRPASGIEYLAHSRWHGSAYRRIPHDG
jgi:hypothetical protein